MNTPTRRLGRGLGSLIAGTGQSVAPSFADEANETSVSSRVQVAKTREDSGVPDAGYTPGSNQLQELMIEHVFPNPNQPRKVIDPEAIKELASSIQSEGLLQPIVVRPSDSGFELIAGERRWRAHQQLGLPTILARVLEVSDLSSASLSLIENLQREQLNPVEEAMGYHSLISDFNLSQQEVSQRMGKSRSHVANLMRLLQLDGELKRLLAQGELSVGHAKVLLSVDDPDRRLAIGRQAVLESWTVRQIEEALGSKFPHSGGAKSRKISPSVFYEDLAKTVSQNTGRKVIIKGSTQGKGRITLSFENETDLNSLLSKIEN